MIMICYLGLGSNMDDRLMNLEKGIDMLSEKKENKILAISDFYESEAMYNKSLNKFYNAVVKIKTTLTPNKLLQLAKDIETQFGRIKSTERYSPRPIDIDILSCGSKIIKSRELVIPHPHIKERKFVLKPWSDIDSDYIIANENRKIKELLDRTLDDSILIKVKQ